MITAHKKWNSAQKQSYVLELGDEFILPEINGRIITGVHRQIYPSLAERLLKTSVGNRVTKSKGRWRLIHDMERDEYKAHLFDPIRFNTKDQLMDGHHRLIAITESGVPQIMQCLYGYTKDDMLSFDQNKGRTVADTLKINGKANPIKRASVIAWIYTTIHSDSIGRQVSKPGSKDAMRISDYFSDDLWQAQIHWYDNNVKSTFGLPSGPIITLRLLYDIVNPEMSEDFWDGVFLGKDNTYLDENKGDARNALHTKLVKMHRELRKPNTLRKEWTPSEVMRWVHYAWMRYEAGQPLQQMTSRKTAYDKAWVNLNLLAKKHFVIDFGQKVSR